MNTKWPRYPKHQIFQNSTKPKFQLIQHVELDERTKFDTSIEANGDRSRRNSSKLAGAVASFPIRFSLHNQRFVNLRPWTNSPHREEAKGTGFVLRRGRNRKVSSALPFFLSAVPPSSGDAVTISSHRWTPRVETKKMGPVRRSEVAGIEKPDRRCPTFFRPFLSLPATT